MNAFRLAFMNVRKRRFSFRLTSLSIMIGLASVILISSVGKSGKEQILATVEGIGMKGVMFTHTTSVIDGRGFDAEFCRTLEEKANNALEAMPFTLDYSDVALAGQSVSALIWGIGENAEDYIDFTLLYGRLPTNEEVRDGSCVAIITDGISQRVFGRSNAVGQRLMIGKAGDDYTIVGVIASGTSSLGMFYADIPDFVYAPYTALSERSSPRAGRMVVISDSLTAESIKSTVKAGIYDAYGSNFKLDITNFNEGRAGVDRVAELLTLILSFAASVSLAVAGIGIMSTMLQTVTARKREIGILKALGATQAQIARSFLWEATLVSLYGLLFGVVAGLATLWLLCRLSVLTFTVNWKIFFLAIAFSGISGLFFGAFPALKAAGEDPIDALKND